MKHWFFAKIVEMSDVVYRNTNFACNAVECVAILYLVEISRNLWLWLGASWLGRKIFTTGIV